MLKKNKTKAIISSVIILLPILFGLIMWNDLPNIMTTHWGADGNADGFSSKAFAVFGLPFILLVLHFICLLFTMLDKKQKEQNPKALGVIFWIIPIISLLVNGIMYRAAFGKEIDLSLFVPMLLGIMLIFMGNYMPKVKQNSTLGIKISWTLQNEENWNKTHRLCGKVWVICGFVLLLCALLPLKAFSVAVPCVIAAAVIIPTVYSYLIYRQHQKQGIVYASSQSKAQKGIRAVIVSTILIVIAIVMLTGSIELSFGENSFKIDATYGADLDIAYSEIESVEYRKDLEIGVRANGFSSAKLSTGLFQNEEFGSYTLYAYTGAKEFVVMSSGEKTLVIGMSDAKATQEIYDKINEKIK